ncbi:MAG: hypothetical protein C0478_11850 [Planctomyces sp.]|nr:hypothetical protein [Planctomyces sp.]
MMVALLGCGMASTIWGVAALYDSEMPPPVPRRHVDRVVHWPRIATLLAVSWVVLSFSLPLILHVFRVPLSPPGPFRVEQVVFLNIQNGFLAVLLLVAIGYRHYKELGIIPTEPGRDLMAAIWAAPLMIVGAALIRLSMTPIIKPEDSHPILKMISLNSPWEVLLLLFFTSAVMAPLFEELLFRVVLQGWLTRQLGSRIAIPTIAIIFALIHGWPDAVPLLIVALTLGFIYDRRRSWLSVAALHAFFNGTMFFMQLLSVAAADALSKPNAAPVPVQSPAPVAPQLGQPLAPAAAPDIPTQAPEPATESSPSQS